MTWVNFAAWVKLAGGTSQDTSARCLELSFRQYLRLSASVFADGASPVPELVSWPVGRDDLSLPRGGGIIRECFQFAGSSSFPPDEEVSL